MISQCPHCQKALQFNQAQMEKIDAALANLKSGALKLGCPLCKKSIALKADGTLYEESPAETAALAPPSLPPSPNKVSPPPAHPDISWLAQGIYAEREVLAEVPKALVLMNGGQDRDAVAKALADRGYQIEMPESGNDALAQMRFGLFAAVVLHADFDGPLTESNFHRQMATMPMDRRRSLFYALIGKEFHTLYHMEALAYSANVVVNDAEVVHFDIILKKGLQEMQELFGPYAEAIKGVSVS